MAIVFNLIWIVAALWPRTISQQALDYFHLDFMLRVQGKAASSYLSSGLEMFVVIVILYLLYRKAYKPGDGLWAGFITGIVFSVFLSVITLPFSLYKGYYLEVAYGLYRQSLWVWLGDYAIQGCINTLIYGVIGALLALAIRWSPRKWHYIVALVLFGFNLLGAFIYPWVIAPVFNTFYPLEDSVILQDVKELTGKAGFTVDRVMVMEASKKTSRVNAYFTGVGSSRQVVLYDTLIQNHTREEIRLILAHELGHWKHGDVLNSLLTSSVAALLALILFRYSWEKPFWRTRKTVMACLVFLVLAGYVTNPVINHLSRKMEVRADRFSLEITEDADAFISGQIGLSTANLSDVDPPGFIRWFAWTHPTTLQRLDSAVGIAENRHK